MGKLTFLESYTNKLKSVLKKDSSFSNLYNHLKDNKIKSFISFDYLEAYEVTLSYKRVIDRVASIVNKPHIKVSYEDVISRSELIKSLDPISVQETIKDSKLWKKKGLNYSPEYVHNIEYTDTIKTYENGFIALLVDLIEKGINNLISQLTPMVKPLEEEYEIKGLNFGKRSFLNEFSPFRQPFENVFHKEKTNSLKVYNLALKLLKRLKNIKLSELYRFNKGSFLDKNVIATNVLLHEVSYSYCYRFYLDNFLKENKEEELKKETTYYNYVVSMLISYIAYYGVGKSKKNILNNINFDNLDKLHFDSFSFRKGVYGFEVEELDEINGLSVKVKLLNKTIRLSSKVAPVRETKYLLLTTYKFDQNNKPYIQEIIDKNKDKYSSIIVITQINTLLEFINVANISIYSKDNFLLIKNLISAMTLLIQTETDIYQKRCPVCGSKDIVNEDGNYVCDKCKSEYALIDINNTQNLWIKSFRRKLT
ncbi:MAG: TFIIB-type zinc ribbon-containing protein [Bacilli bacterium]|nr:TFIIB-type zinc ribbon-containing protein [Bacilli bacterium]